MSLLELYGRFCQDPKAEYLAYAAVMAYVSSGLEFNGQDDIVKQLQKDRQEVKRLDNVISKHQTNSALVLETETSLEFLRGPGSFVPTLSSNLVVDERATIVLVHIVAFDSNSKISGIKFIWDQATLLKQLNVIGNRGNAWPICKGQDQAKLSNKVQQNISERGHIENSISLSDRAVQPSGQNNLVSENQPLRSSPASPNYNTSQNGMPCRLIVKESSKDSKAMTTNIHSDTQYQTRPKPRAKEVYINLFSEEDDLPGYTRIIGGGGGGYGDARKGLKPSWHWGDEGSQENSIFP
ncbi:Pc12g03400 [Sugiyamaella lignohabitans]|uniref:Pc12g03400 n=1 Tax=Sugiyamaella lignohabitans TaxID=796027 RepID=A0A161HH44_9ASCO|nr:Pc12g03400 [Sugiyamaella lignohabitans]ANB15210.1 Pc12g03400 [Sugiyamaella lignohabitans]